MNFDSFWGRTCRRLLGMVGSESKPIRKRRSPASRRRRQIESLELRTVMTASFGSAIDIGGASSDAVFDVAVDSAGNSYATGYFSGTVDFDLSHSLAGDADILTSRGSHDAFVAKYAPDDSLIWVRRMGGDRLDAATVTDAARDVTVDSTGNVYVAGEFHESADFGPTTLTAVAGKDSFATKLSANGDFLWAQRWGTTENDQSDGGDVDGQGNFYVVSRQADGDYDILKYSSSGSAVWNRSLIGTNYVAADLTVSSSGSVYVAGTFDGIVDFDPSSKTKYVSAGPSMAGFVLKLDSAGKFNWVTPFVGKTVNGVNGYAFASSIALDNSGGVVVGGLYRNTVDFNPSSATTSLDPVGGAYIARLNGTGGLTWAKALVNTGTYASNHGLAVDASGDIYATGSFYGTIDLDPGTPSVAKTSNGASDLYVVKLTSAGNFAWGETFGGTGAESALGIDVGTNGDVHVAIYYYDQVDFDPSPLTSYYVGSSGAARNGLRLRLLQS
ncbi:MAG: SBBP repeat-containing protein [Pirellulales bacterium]